ncbi:hypothetical protein V2I01_26775 [Micromonospora sp. BRA006-A]|nr:hypothetical protein [Micromonospora sp. BRA006-A]
MHLVDKEFFLATRVVDLLLAEPSYAAGTRLSGDRRPAAAALPAGRAAGGGWAAFLAAVVEMLRTRRRDRADDRASSGSSPRGTRCGATSATRRPGGPRRAPDPGWQPCRPGCTRATGRSRHRWSRCFRRWPRPCCTGAPAGGGCW